MIYQVKYYQDCQGTSYFSTFFSSCCDKFDMVTHTTLMKAISLASDYETLHD